MHDLKKCFIIHPKMTDQHTPHIQWVVNKYQLDISYCEKIVTLIHIYIHKTSYWITNILQNDRLNGTNFQIISPPVLLCIYLPHKLSSDDKWKTLKLPIPSKNRFPLLYSGSSCNIWTCSNKPSNGPVILGKATEILRNFYQIITPVL